MHAFSTPLLFVLLAGFAVSGCATYAVEDIVRRPDRERHRIDDDVYRYVQYVDREIRLDRRQEQYVTRLLRDRTYRLLDRVDPRDRRYVYPFPRHHYGDMNAAKRDFWRRADRDIARRLTRAQARRYAYITGSDPYRRYSSSRLFGRRVGIGRTDYGSRSERIGPAERGARSDGVGSADRGTRSHGVGSVERGTRGDRIAPAEGGTRGEHVAPTDRRPSRAETSGREEARRDAD